MSLDLASGTRAALIGPNGSGKTTLTRVVMGLVAHDGVVRLDGQSGARARIHAARDIAYVPQVAPAMAVSVGDLVRTVAGVRGRAVDAIQHIAAELGLALGPIAKLPFRGLSGGMKQKVLIALALGVEPRLVILDEPTASLDAPARARFAALEREFLVGATVILSSHRLDELRTMVDRVVALADGRLVHDGPAAAYVAGHTQSVLEVLADADEAWLPAQGFVATSGGWWSRAVDHDEKLALLPQIVTALGPRLRDVVVRDLERLAPLPGGGS
ncbi:MAG: ABC transporter ATP-binding protein [Myxococcota bacterium]